MNTFYVLRGLPGSGKSYLANKLIDMLGLDTLQIVSTDHYWLRPDGYYDFNFQRLSEAHAWAYRMACEAFDLNVKTVILDNTNTRRKEFDKYVSVAHKHGYAINLMEPDTSWRYDPSILAEKNTHKVPLATIEKMLARWEPTNSIKAVLKERGYDVL